MDGWVPRPILTPYDSLDVLILKVFFTDQELENVLRVTAVISDKERFTHCCTNDSILPVIRKYGNECLWCWQFCLAGRPTSEWMISCVLSIVFNMCNTKLEGFIGFIEDHNQSLISEGQQFSNVRVFKCRHKKPLLNVLKCVTRVKYNN